MSERKRFLSVAELLELAAPLYGVGDGCKTRTMIDAVRDVYFEHHAGAKNCGDDCWRGAMEALTAATDPALFGGFQAWEDQEGRTVEERREAFVRAIPIAIKQTEERQQARDTHHCDCY